MKRQCKNIESTSPILHPILFLLVLQNDYIHIELYVSINNLKRKHQVVDKGKKLRFLKQICFYVEARLELDNCYGEI